MFEKFGEFDSYKELNEAAKGLLEEGDLKSLAVLAGENGIDEEDVQDYIDGLVPELVSASSAAYGRLQVEENEIKKKASSEKMALSVIRNMVQVMCTDEDMEVAVMKKGKRIEKILEAMKNAARKNKSGNMGICCGTDRELQGIIRAYYLETKNNFEKKIDDLYRG